MRTLALDHGSARCGVAVSDAAGVLARPLDSVAAPDTQAGLDAIADLVAEFGVEVVVVGLPLTLAGRTGSQAQVSLEFAKRLGERLPVPVKTYDERFTSRQARGTIARQREVGARTRSGEDSIAAAHLLTAYLDAQSLHQKDVS